MKTSKYKIGDEVFRIKDNNTVTLNIIVGMRYMNQKETFIIRNKFSDGTGISGFDTSELYETYEDALNAVILKN